MGDIRDSMVVDILPANQSMTADIESHIDRGDTSFSEVTDGESVIDDDTGLDDDIDEEMDVE
jgi:hypothetical protein